MNKTCEYGIVKTSIGEVRKAKRITEADGTVTVYVFARGGRAHGTVSERKATAKQAETFEAN